MLGAAASEPCAGDRCDEVVEVQHAGVVELACECDLVLDAL